MSKNNEPQFILASASPRRKKLLSEAGYHFEVLPSSVDEDSFYEPTLSSRELTEILAAAKADDISKQFPDRIVVGSDTVVDFQGQIIGKPDDAEHARQITELLFSAPHDVITGVAVIRQCDGYRSIRSAVTRVFPHRLSPEQIDMHIQNGQWQGKAGAYGIQETGDEFVERIEGSFTNVIGLPMEMIAEMLNEVL